MANKAKKKKVVENPQTEVREERVVRKTILRKAITGPLNISDEIKETFSIHNTNKELEN